MRCLMSAAVQHDCCRDDMSLCITIIKFTATTTITTHTMQYDSSNAVAVHYYYSINSDAVRTACSRSRERGGAGTLVRLRCLSYCPRCCPGTLTPEICIVLCLVVLTCRHTCNKYALMVTRLPQVRIPYRCMFVSFAHCHTDSVRAGERCMLCSGQHQSRSLPWT